MVTRKIKVERPQLWTPRLPVNDGVDLNLYRVVRRKVEKNFKNLISCLTLDYNFLLLGDEVMCLVDIGSQTS